MTDVSVLSEVENTEKPLQVNIADAIKQLRTIDPRPEARFDLASIDPEKKGGLHAKTFLGAELERPEFAAWVKRENTKRNVYATANEARAGAPRDIKLADEDVGTYRVFFVDIDLNRDNGDTRTKSEVIAEQAGSDYPPTLIIDSGNGIWFVWVLKTPATVESIDGASQAAGLIERFKSDASCKEPSRLMRLAGTINRKAGFPDALACVVTASGPKTTPEEIAAWCPPVVRVGPKQDAPQGAIDLVELDTPENVAACLAFLDKEWRVAVLHDGGRRATILALHGCMDRGVSPKMAAILVHRFLKTEGEEWELTELEDLSASLVPSRQNAKGVLTAGAEFPAVDIPETAPAEKPKRPALIHISGIKRDITAPARHLIQGVYDAGAFVVTYGESNSGKSNVALNQMLHIAAGLPWRGRAVRQGAVVYVAAEGAPGLQDRIEAYKASMPEVDWDKVPFYLWSFPADFLHNSGDAEFLVEQIRALEAETGVKCVAVVVDTLSRVMAGGDENGSVDMGKVVRQCEKIRLSLNVTLHLIHHAGKNAAKGARGHSLLRAAVDTEIEIEDMTIVCRKQRDMEFFTEMRFGYQPVTLPAMVDGTARSSIVLTDASVEDFSPEMTPQTQNVLEAAQALVTQKLQTAGTKNACSETAMFSIKELVASGLPQRTTERSAKELVELGGFIKCKHGLYKLK